MLWFLNGVAESLDNPFRKQASSMNMSEVQDQLNAQLQELVQNAHAEKPNLRAGFRKDCQENGRALQTMSSVRKAFSLRGSDGRIDAAKVLAAWGHPLGSGASRNPRRPPTTEAVNSVVAWPAREAPTMPDMTEQPSEVALEVPPSPGGTKAEAPARATEVSALFQKVEGSVYAEVGEQRHPQAMSPQQRLRQAARKSLQCENEVQAESTPPVKVVIGDQQLSGVPIGNQSSLQLEVISQASGKVWSISPQRKSPYKP